jgi:arginase
MASRGISIIGAPSSAGAYAPGQEKAPAAWRRHGLIDAISSAGLSVRDRGDTPEFRWRPDLVRPKAMNLEAVADTARAVASMVETALAEGEAALVLGGDCTVELGTIAGALRGTGSLGLVYLDFDTDLNPPADSDGALDWTGVAHLLDIPGTESLLAGLGPRRPMLAADDVLFLAVENLTEGERRTVAERNIALIGMDEVHADPHGAANHAVEWASRFDRLAIHLDVDVLSFTDFPIAENTRRCDGLKVQELAALLRPLLASPNWSALTLTEVNPDHAPDERESFVELVKLISARLQE